MPELIFADVRHLEWRDATRPRIQSDAEAIVRPLAVATCDLDFEIVAGRAPFGAGFPLGHECVAEVLDVGSAVTGHREGDRVVVPFQISCGNCRKCRAGKTSNCESVPRSSTYGFGPQVERYRGFLSDAVRVPFADHMLVPLPKGIAADAAASASDNIPDAWRAVGPGLKREPGGAVLVVGGWGAGSIGLYAAGLAVSLESERVLYVDVDESPARKQSARELGAEVHDGPLPRRLGPFPITVNATASQDALNLALRSTATDGSCTSTGIFLGQQPTLPLLEMYEKVVTFRTGRAHVRPHIPAVVELIASERFDPEPVRTRTVAWDQAIDALVELDWTKLIISRDGMAAGFPG